MCTYFLGFSLQWGDNWQGGLHNQIYFNVSREQSTLERREAKNRSTSLRPKTKLGLSRMFCQVALQRKCWIIKEAVGHYPTVPDDNKNMFTAHISHVINYVHPALSLNSFPRKVIKSITFLSLAH